MIALDETSSNYEIGVILFVEYIRSYGVEIQEDGPASILRAQSAKLIAVSRVQCRVWSTGVVEVVEPVSYELALSSSECVTTRESDEIRGTIEPDSSETGFKLIESEEWRRESGICKIEESS